MKIITNRIPVADLNTIQFSNGFKLILDFYTPKSWNYKYRTIKIVKGEGGYISFPTFFIGWLHSEHIH